MARKYLRCRGFKLVVLINSLCAMSFLLTGYDQGVMNGIMTLPRFKETFPVLDNKSTLLGLTVAIYELGCFFGALSCICIGDILGRCKTIFLGSFVLIVGATIQASVSNFAPFLIGRMMSGFGNGINSATVPMWQAECSNSRNRGRLILTSLSINVAGYTISNWLELGFFFVQGNVGFRFPLAFQVFFAMFLLSTPFLPDSPRWLVMKRHDAEAAVVLGALADLPSDDSKIAKKLADIKESLSMENVTRKPRKQYIHRSILAILIQLFQQIGGINAISFYATIIFENFMGMSPFMARVLSAASATEYFVASCLAQLLIEKFGRRKSYLYSGIGMGIAMTVLAGCTYTQFENLESNSRAGIASIVMIFFYYTCFGIGWLGVSWLYPTEIVPLEIRAIANGLSTAVCWISNFVVVMIVPTLFDVIQWKTYLVFAVFIFVLILPVFYWVFPETKNTSLEGIDSFFTEAKSWRAAVLISLKKQ